MPIRVKLDEISSDDSTQARVAIDQDTVDRYTEDMKEGAKFPPVTLHRDEDNTLRVGDGFHRIAAARKAGRDSIEAEVLPGGKRDALMYSIEANSRHGLNFSNADKRKIVELMLNDPAFSTDSDRSIAKRCGVSQPFVSSLRKSRQGDNGYHSGPLTDEERAWFAELEAKLEALMPAVKQFWCALTEVRDERLYRGTHASFEEYLTKTFGADMPRKVLVFEKMVTGQEVSEADLDCFRKVA